MNSLFPSLTPFESDMFRPVYQPFIGERWQLRIAQHVLCAGYWSTPQLVTGMAALVRVTPTGTSTWMSMTPMETESQELGCRHAVGHVVIMGLGMGWAAANAALRPEVTRVTVIEKDPEVIEFVRQSAVFAQLPSEVAARITVLNDDAFTYIPDQPADTLMADIWLPLFGADRDEEVRRMHANTGGRRVYFWGQEMVIAHRARLAGLPLDTATVAQLVADMRLPLIGPGERPDYPELIQTAAARWLKPANTPPPA